MYRRYQIETAAAPPLRRVPNKFHPVVRRVRLATMLIREAFRHRFRKEVLLSRPCIYGVFSGPIGGFAPRRQRCVGCMRCVQEYPEICQVSISDAWKALGDSYFSPDSISTLHYEAATGKVPVKGVGYKGPFTGPGFDAVWTDMSEIVRPTRDGIYGREYISTVVDLGRKPAYVDPEQPLSPETERVLEVPLPILFDRLPSILAASGAERALRHAARRLETLCLVPWERSGVRLGDDRERQLAAATVPVVPARELEQALAALAAAPAFPAVEVEDLVPADVPRLGRALPKCVLLARLALDADTGTRVGALADAGVGVFHLAADYHGRARDGAFVKEAVQAVHDALIAARCREEVTLIASGGIVRAEHVPKAIIAGADLTAVDTAAWVALGGTFRGELVSPEQGTFELPSVGAEWGAQRLVNLCAAWRDQLLEILSAMGLREVRRLRGELGRAMACDDLEREAFGDLERVG